MEVAVDSFGAGAQLPAGVSSIDQFIFFADRLQAGRYLTLAVFSLLILEYFHTFDEEVRYIWKTGPLLMWTKALFVVVRYLPLLLSAVRLYVMVAPDMTFDVCYYGVIFTAWTGVLSAAGIEITLMLRIWALYGRSRTILIFFSVIAVLGTAGGLAILQLNPPVPSFLAPVAPPSMTTCTHGNPTQYPLLFLLLASVELTIFVLLIRKASYVIGPRGAAPVITALVKHGAFYFLCVFLCLLLAAIAPFIHAIAQPIMDSEFTVNISAAACVRLVFSLRGTQVDRQADGDEMITGASINIAPAAPITPTTVHIPLSPRSPGSHKRSEGSLGSLPKSIDAYSHSHSRSHGSSLGKNEIIVLDIQREPMQPLPGAVVTQGWQSQSYQPRALTYPRPHRAPADTAGDAGQWV